MLAHGEAHLYIEHTNNFACSLSQVALTQEVKSVHESALIVPQLINSEVWWKGVCLPYLC